MKPRVVIDTRGLYCPLPVIKTSDALQNIDPGGLVEVIADDPAIVLDLPAWCDSNGHTIRHREKHERTYRFIVEKGGAAAGEPGAGGP